MKTDTQSQFGNNIKSLRLHKSMSQLEMAKQFNMSRTSYAQYESGTRYPDMATLIDIADFFGVKMDTLFHAESKEFMNDVLLYNAMGQVEHELLETFASLSDYSKGKLLERAHMLHDEEEKLIKELTGMEYNEQNNK